MEYAKFKDKEECYQSLGLGVNEMSANKQIDSKYYIYPKKGMVGGGI